MFKNLVIYNMSRVMNFEIEELKKNIEAFKFIPCLPQDIIKSGFVPYIKGAEELVYDDRGQILLTILTQEKILPAAVINEFLSERIESFEENNGRKPKKTEKDALKDAIINELLPKAFSKYGKTQIWIDLNNRTISVNCGSNKKAEDSLALLRKAVGSLPVTPISPNNPPDVVMTDWLKNGVASDGFLITDEVELKSSIDEGVVTSKKQELPNDEVLNHIESGKFVSKMSFNFEDSMSLLLTNELLVKKIKMSDITSEKIEDDLGDTEGLEARFASEFFIFTAELSTLIKAISSAFNCETEDGDYNKELKDSAEQES